MHTKFYFVITASLILIDQLSKLAANKLGWSIFLNNQFAFSLPVPVFAMYLIYAIVFLAMSYYVISAWVRFSNQQKLAWTFVYAGGLSNVGERILFGHVIDFIPIANGMLNGADFFIIIGLILLLTSTRRELKDSHSVEETQ